MNEKDYNKVKTALYTALIYDTEKGEIIGFDPVPLFTAFRTAADWDTLSAAAVEMGRRGELWENLPDYFRAYGRARAARAAA